MKLKASFARKVATAWPRQINIGDNAIYQLIDGVASDGKGRRLMRILNDIWWEGVVLISFAYNVPNIGDTSNANGNNSDTTIYQWRIFCEFTKHEVYYAWGPT